MIYITGDTHGDFRRFWSFCQQSAPTGKDIIIILGDAGLNYYGDQRDVFLKEQAARYPFTFFCIHGNHEMRPKETCLYTTRKFHGGTVWHEPDFSTLLFAKDGEIYNFDGNSCIVIGGAYSVDKYCRLAHGWNWFESEQPSEKTKAYVERKLAARDNRIDVVLSHTCPLKYEPTEVFMNGIDQSRVDKGTEKWLGKIEESISYDKWYCGHYHTSKKIDKMQFMFEDIAAFEP